MYQNTISNNLNQALTISGIKAFTDNYIWCVADKRNAMVVDPGDASPVISYLTMNQLSLTDILITHHHWDHVGGLDELKKAYPDVKIHGPNNPKIHQIEDILREGDRVELTHFDLSFDILQTPGHTLDHIVYSNHELIFCGDTLFSGGCGRMFEGTPEVFYESLQKLASLPASLKVYCTHEYTLANLNFALSVEPNNSSLKQYFHWVKTQRESDLCTLPSTIARELAINPFLRCHSDDIRNNMNDVELELNREASSSMINPRKEEILTFAALRKLKDNF